MNDYLNDLGLVCCLGNQRAEILGRLLNADRSGLSASDAYRIGQPLYLGQVDVDLPQVPMALSLYDCRNNRLLLAALVQIRSSVEAMRARFGHERIGIVLGTSTSGVRNTELALQGQAEQGELPTNYHYKQQQMGSGAEFLARFLNVNGPTYTISTACSSSGKAFASAKRLLDLNLCDAVIVGGADSLCGLTIHGFAALESISSGLCKPFGQHRDGINIGEAAALFVLSRQPGPVRLCAVAATSDAYHFSAPDPDGTAVIAAMQSALQQAQVLPEQIDYLNLHGTATLLNDAMESRAVHALFADSIAVSSTKGMTGHCLGASAALELGFCWMLLNRDDADGQLIPNANDDDIDPALPSLNWIKPGQRLGRAINTCLCNSFAFGGSNVSILLARTI